MGLCPCCGSEGTEPEQPGLRALDIEACNNEDCDVVLYEPAV